MSEYLDSLVHTLSKNPKRTLAQIVTQFTQLREPPQDDSVLELLNALKLSSLTASELQPDVDLLDKLFTGWSGEISDDQPLDVLAAGLNVTFAPPLTKLNVLTQIVRLRLPSALTGLNLRATLEQVMAAVSRARIIDEEQLRMNLQKYVSDMASDMAEQLQKQIINAIQQQIQQFDREIEDKVARAEQRITDAENQLNAKIMQSQTFQSPQYEKMHKSQKNYEQSPQNDLKKSPVDQLKLTKSDLNRPKQLQPNPIYPTLSSHQSIDPVDMNRRLNTVAEQTHKALEAVQLALRQQNQKINEIGGHGAQQNKPKDVQRLYMRVQQLEFEVSELRARLE